MRILKSTVVSLLGYEYVLKKDDDPNVPYSVECLKDGELFTVDFFGCKKRANSFFDTSRTTLPLS